MKRIAFVVFLLAALSLCAQPELNKVYYYDYGPVTRLVLAFNHMPEYRFDNDSSNRRLTINVAQASIGSAVTRQKNVSSAVLQTISVLPNGNGIKINILTHQRFTVEPFKLQNGMNKIVLDVYTTKNPTAPADQISLARFYYLVHFYSQATELCQRLDNGHSETSPLHYYWGKILLESGRSNEAISHFQKVTPGREEYRAAQNELVKLGKASKAPTPTKTEPAPKPTKSTPAPAPAVAQPEPTPAHPTTPESDKNAEAKFNLTADSLAASYKGYYEKAGSLLKQLLLLASVAQECGDHASAVRYLTETLNHLDKNSPQASEIHRRLADSYTALNMPEMAKIQRAQVTETKTAAAPVSLFQTLLPLWLALLMALGFALIVLFVTITLRHRQHGHQSQYDLDDADVQRITDGYRETYGETSLAPEPEPEALTPLPVEPVLPTEAAPEPAEPETSDFDVYHPPLVAEELTPEEDAELNPSESPIKYQSVNYEAFDSTESLFEKLDDSGYKTKMVRKLADDGWDAQAIAKELQMSVNEVEYILTTE